MNPAELARKWSEEDPNAESSQWLKKLIENAEMGNGEASERLKALFPGDGRRIKFGTAGLRSAMQVGPLGMNDMVVVQTAQGLVRYCQQESNQENLRIVIGYDHRANSALNLSSLSFAILSAIVFEQAGVEYILMDGFIHTPTIAFATTRLKAIAGIMVTASHNPKNDAGYKVYWSDGCQIRPPLDKGIEASILENLDPWVDYRTILQKRRDEHGEDKCLGLSNIDLTNKMKMEYFEALQNSGILLKNIDYSAEIGTPKFAYTAMHGVGYPYAQRVFEEFGLPPFHSVIEQQDPDPFFSTVGFPNPEEKGALDMAKKFAEEQCCSIVFANDPDADRLAVAEFDEATRTWCMFTGDQIGVLLGHWLWSQIGKTSEKVRLVESNDRLCYRV